MRRSDWFALLPMLTFSAAVLCGCATEPGAIPIYEERGNWVGLKYDSAAGSGHSHPYTFLPEHMAKVLGGMTVAPRDTIVGFLEGETRPAFSAEQIARLTPHLVQAFKKASTHDIVVFYLTSIDARLGQLITSGGLCVRGTRLYVMLANYLTPPSAGPFEGIAYELDARENPLLPIARYKFSVGVVPEAVRISNQEADRLDPYRSNMDLSKRVVVDLTRLFSRETPRQAPTGR